MIELMVVLGMVLLLAGMLYLRRAMPWPFQYDGRTYKRLKDGSFVDAEKRPVTDPSLKPELQRAYESAKYGDGELKGWSTSD